MRSILSSRLIITAVVFLAAACYGQTSNCVAITQASQFNFRNIDVPGAQSTFASGINNSGTIVGTFTDAAGVFHGYSNNVDGDSFRQIDFPGSASTQGAGLNDTGDIVGEYTDSSGVGHGFLLRDGSFGTIDFPNGTFTFATGVNNGDAIVGSYSSADSSTHGFLLDKNEFTTVDDPNQAVLNGTSGPFTVSQVFIANDRQQLVGIFLDANLNFNGFLFSGGSFQTINVPGAMSTIPFGLNNDDTIVGEYIDPQFVGHGYIQRALQITTVDFPGATTTLLGQMNSAGLIVGEYTDAAGNTHSFLAERLDGSNLNADSEQQEAACQAPAQAVPSTVHSNALQTCHASVAKGPVVCSSK